MEDNSEIDKGILTVYLGQNVRSATSFGVRKGILRHDLDAAIAYNLKSHGLIQEETWYNLVLYRTTPQGDINATEALSRRISLARATRFFGALEEIPKKLIAFAIRRFLYSTLTFPTVRPSPQIGAIGNSWPDKLLSYADVWVYCNSFLEALERTQLCTKAHYYVSSHGGRMQDYLFVTSQEVVDFLMEEFPYEDISKREEEQLEIYQILSTTSNWFNCAIDLNAQPTMKMFNNMLIERNLKESQIKPIVNEASQENYTSEYRIDPEKKPFQIFDLVRFLGFLEQKLVVPIVDVLLE